MEIDWIQVNTFNSIFEAVYFHDVFRLINWLYFCRCGDLDIWFGARSAVDTLLVLTGVHSLADCEKKENHDKVPTYVAESVAEAFMKQ